MTNSDEIRQLNQKQLNAIELLLQGKNDGEVAEEVSVARQTINEWKNHNSGFIAEINLRRHSMWAAQVERLRGLIEQAVNVVETDLQSNDPKAKRNASIHILKCVGLYGEQLKPIGDIDADVIEKKWRDAERWDGLFDF